MAGGKQVSKGEYMPLNDGHDLPNNSCQAPAAAKHRHYVAVLRILLSSPRRFSFRVSTAAAADQQARVFNATRSTIQP